MKRIFWLLIALHAPLASAVYKCVDERGNTLFGDTPPAGCGNVPIYEVSQSGTVLRKIEPTPTPEQVRARLEEQERRKQAELIAAEQRRKDMALLNSYGSPREFDVALDRNIEPVTGRIGSAEERIHELDKREQQIVEQIEYYKSGEGKDAAESGPPAWLVANLDTVRKERATLTRAIVRYRKEIEDLRTRFESDKKRWIFLKANAGTLRAQETAAAEASKAPAKGAKAGY